MLALVAKLDKAGRDMIEGPITLNEIKTAVDSLTNCTAPGPNEHSAKFYKKQTKKH